MGIKYDHFMEKLMQTKPNYRHGDVIVKRIDALPKEAEPLKTKVVMEGEQTGHAHRLEGAGELFRWNEKLYLKVTKRAALTHEEHARGELDEGFYEIAQQNAWKEDGWAKVID